MSSAPGQLLTRRAAATDAAALAELCHHLGYPAQAGDIARRLSRISDRESQVVLVAEDADLGVVGWVHVFTARRLESESFAELGGLVVAPEAQGRGGGRRLVEAAQEWSRAQGLARLRVRSNTVRGDAHAFYTHLGFVRSKEQAVFDRCLDQKDARA